MTKLRPQVHGAMAAALLLAGVAGTGAYSIATAQSSSSGKVRPSTVDYRVRLAVLSYSSDEGIPTAREAETTALDRGYLGLVDQLKAQDGQVLYQLDVSTRPGRTTRCFIGGETSQVRTKTVDSGVEVTQTSQTSSLTSSFEIVTMGDTRHGLNVEVDVDYYEEFDRVRLRLEESNLIEPEGGIEFRRLAEKDRNIVIVFEYSPDR